MYLVCKGIWANELSLITWSVVTWQEAVGLCAIPPVSPLALSGWSLSVLLCLIRLFSMQNTLPDGPSAESPVADLP